MSDKTLREAAGRERTKCEGCGVWHFPNDPCPGHAGDFVAAPPYVSPEALRFASVCYGSGPDVSAEIVSRNIVEAYLRCVAPPLKHDSADAPDTVRRAFRDVEAYKRLYKDRGLRIAKLEQQLNIGVSTVCSADAPEGPYTTRPDKSGSGDLLVIRDGDDREWWFWGTTEQAIAVRDTLNRLDTQQEE